MQSRDCSAPSGEVREKQGLGSLAHAPEVLGGLEDRGHGVGIGPVSDGA